MRNAEFLTKKLSALKEIKLPFVSSNVKHVFHQYTIRFLSKRISRSDFIEKLNENGIKTAIHYPLPIHKQPLYQKLGYDDYLPEVVKAAKEVLSLPVHPALTIKDLDFIISKIKLNLR
jgi:perosamine synthetase